jgi:spore coat protein CotH
MILHHNNEKLQFRPEFRAKERKIIMLRHWAFAVALTAVTASMGQIPDSSDFIFDDTKIQKYELSFYIDKWTDTLEANRAADQVYIPARMTWHGANGDSMTLDSIGVRYKGNSSYQFAGANPKKPYKFCFDKYKKNQTFFNLEVINFGNLVHDPSCMREKISYDLIRKYMPASRASYAIISVNHKQIGLFLQVEEVDVGFLKRNFQDYQGNLYKSSDDGALLDFRASKQRDYEDEYDLRTNTGINDWSGLILMLENLNTTSDANFVKNAGKYLDLDGCIRYLAYNMVTSNFDSYTGSSRNIYLYDDRLISGQFILIPWDFNLGLGNYSNNWNVITVDAFNIPNLSDRPLAKRILGNDSLKQVYGRYMSSMIRNYMSHDAMAAMADRIMPIIDSAVMNDPNAFYKYDQFLANIENDLTITDGATRYTVPGIKSFPTARNAQLQTQIDREKIQISILNPLSNSRGDAVAFRCIAGANGKRIVLNYSVKTKTPGISILMHDARGQLVRSINEGAKIPGSYSKSMDTRSMPAGFYTVSLKTGKVVVTTALTLMKNK